MEENNGLSELSTVSVIGSVEAGMVDSADLGAHTAKAVAIIDDELTGINSADLGASKPIAQQKFKTRPVEHARVVACGHKLEAGHFPKHSNCEDCWHALFETSPEGVASVHQLLLTDGTRAVTAIHGEKFTKFFGKYLQRKLLAMHQQSGEQIAEGLQVLDINAERTA